MECNNENGQKKPRGWGFAFFGGTPERPWEEADSQEIVSKATDRESGAVAPFPLALSNVGDRVWVVGIQDKEVISRLLALRLTPGTELAIVSRSPSGSVIVAFQDKQIGLGANIVHKILVTNAIGTDGRSVAGNSRVSTSSKVQPMNRDTNTYLCNLPVGCRGRIVGYEQVTGGYKGRLLAMGLTPGTEFTVIRHGTLGDPIEIEVQGCKLILQKHEADVLCIEELSSFPD
ncbi:MAG TPA: ferrous iron transport protein A [Cyanobacteria bacterium UBA8553]|nr:ferrous iron transport protein A [Cyanobacteria bacterium UBA8553]HAJ60233.1 ferrous iron transport protein A [Cyanobacteria bacterium UBA8543]